MASSNAIAKALATLAAAGVDISPMQKDLLSAQFSEIFKTKIENHNDEETAFAYFNDVANWVADFVVSDLKNVQGRGEGKNFVHLIGVDTEIGHLQIKLTRPDTEV